MIAIYPAKKHHINDLAFIERAAAQLFSEIDLPAPLRDQVISEQAHLDALAQGLLLVALEDGVKPVGFAISTRFSSFLHLLEIDVLPDYQGRGIGTALLAGVCSLARDQGCDAVTLTTYKYVPWNAPWYERKGFQVLDDDVLPDHLRSILDEEGRRGLDPEKRVAMLK